MSKYTPHHLDSVAATMRDGQRIKLFSPLNQKSPKGEKAGYLTAMLYLAPHTVAGGKSVCPHSTAECRAGCLFTAGRGTTPRVHNARVRRTQNYLEDRPQFMATLLADLTHMQAVADDARLTLAIRLNGTSDILWEREEPSIFDAFPRAVFYDYTRTPAAHRRVPENWKLTFSLADDALSFAFDHLSAGRNVAAVVPDIDREHAPGWFLLGDRVINVVDGEENDLRFLDEPPSLVLLKPKGRLRRGGPMVRHHLIGNLLTLHRNAA